MSHRKPIKLSKSKQLDLSEPHCLKTINNTFSHKEHIKIDRKERERKKEGGN